MKSFFAARMGAGVSLAVFMAVQFYLAGSAMGQQEPDLTGGDEPIPVENPAISNSVSVNPFGLLVGMVSLEYQHAVSDGFAISMRGSYWSVGIQDWRVRWTGGGVGLRRYWGERAPQGGYLALNLDVGTLEATFTDEMGLKDSVSVFNAMPNVMLGYSWFVGRFHMDAGFGMSYLTGRVVVMGESFPYNGLIPSLGFNMGFGF